MQLRIKSEKDFWAGILFIGLGVLAILVALNYPKGDAVRMGPGYFPTMIGGILIVLGAIVSLTSFAVEGEKLGAFAWKPMVLLTLAFAAFGWLIDRIGFVAALVALILLSALAGKDFRVKEVIVLTTALIVGAWLLFIHILELPFILWWR